MLAGSNRPSTGRRARVASARLALSLALIAAGRHDEAADLAEAYREACGDDERPALS